MESGGNDVLGSLDQILLSLEGTTTLEKPKVSRDVMVEVLKEHTELIRSLRVDLRAANEAISMQTEALIECRKVMASMNDEIKRGKAETNSLRKVTTKLTEDTKDIRQDMGITQVKIAGLGNIMELEQITHRLSADYTEFKKETKISVESLRERNKEVDVKLVEVKKMVKETGQTLTLPSSQIMVESMVEGQGPCKLAEVLTDYAASMDATKALLQEQLAKIESNATELSLKAEATITIDIDALYSRMHAAEALLKRDSEQGVSEIRRQCEDLTMGLENVQVELAEKINRDNVELIVHKKYEDIVQYLHEALHASKSDEEMFNRKADELRDAVKRLGISKADRFEIAAMQDSVMKTENMVTKLKAQDGSMGESIRSADVFSKTEISELLAAKVDRVEYEQSIRDLQKRRFSRIGLTEAPEKASPAVGDNYVKGENILPVPDAVRETRLTPIVTTRGEDSAANSQYIQASSSQKQQLTSNIRGSPEQSQKALGAIEGKGLGGGSSGKSVNLRASDSASAQIQATDRSAVVRVPVTGTDLGNFLKMSTLQTAGRAMFPQDLFRSNKTTDKHTTGLNAAGESSHSVPQSTYLPEYEFAAKADMSFVGASVIGAGFNTRSANIVKGPVLAYHQTPSTADTKSLVQGPDGHYYHMDPQ